MVNRYYFSHARVALWVSILDSNPKEDFNILIPDYICESIPNFLMAKNVKFITYKIKINLKVDWDDLNAKFNNKCKFLLIVNYFGFPLDLNLAIDFANKNKIILIEDSTHGHGGKFQGQYLGSFGNYGITSPRKHIPLKFGGVLYSKNKIDLSIFTKNYHSRVYDKVNYLISSKFLKQKLFLKKIIKKKVSKILNVYEDIIKVSLLDEFSRDIIDNTNWNKLRQIKSENFNFWLNYCKKKDLNVLITDDVKSLNPWALPVLLNSEEEVIDWLNWGNKNKVIIFTWPTLYKDFDKTSDAYKLSQRLICFSTYTRLDNV